LRIPCIWQTLVQPLLVFMRNEVVAFRTIPLRPSFKLGDANALTIPDGDFEPEDYNEMEPTSVTVYGYDQRGNRTYEQKPAGGEILTDYTVSGLPEKVAYFDSNSYVGYTYDDRGLKVQEDYNDVDKSRRWHITFNYDDMGRLIDTWWRDYDNTSVMKHQSSWYYGSGKKKYDKVYGYGNTLEKQTDYYYDILGRTTKSIVDPGAGKLNLTTEYYYDAVGNRTCVKDTKDNCFFSDYDNANRETAEYFGELFDTDLPTTKASATVKKKTRYYENNLIRDANSYDYGGTALLARDAFEYDARGRVTKVTQKIDAVNEAETVYDYNDWGFIVNGSRYQIRITDANNKQTCIALDAFGRRAKTLYPSQDYQELQYNGDGTMKAKAVWNASGTTKYWINYFYDAYGRLRDVNYPDNGNIHYTYDGFGRRTLAKDNRAAADSVGGDNEISYDYDVLGRTTAVTDQNDYKINYTYQGDGQKKASIQVTKPGPSLIYHTEYHYDAAGRLEEVTEPLLGTNSLICTLGFDDDCGCSSKYKKITYSLDGTSNESVSVEYTHNHDSFITDYNTTAVGVTGPTFKLTDADIDGLGRLTYAKDTITKANQSTVAHTLIYQYDMLSQLTDANVSNIDSSNWAAHYTYKKNGDMTSRKIKGLTENFDYYGHRMIDANGVTLTWDENGNMKTGVSTSLAYNWDSRLRSGQKGNDSIALKYDPDGNRIRKQSVVSGQTTRRRYVVDIVGNLPVILMELDSADSDSIKKIYIYANNQIVAQHNGNHNADRYFYLHDRLGSVRQVINTSGNVVKYYTYEPFGKVIESGGTLANSFMFTGQLYDSEIGEYYLRARQYDPHISRFTARDPVEGCFKEPLSSHVYLYCQNDPMNRTDPTGRSYLDKLLWGPILLAPRTTQTIAGINAYYGLLDIFLGETANPAEMLNWLPGVNAYREFVFSGNGPFEQIAALSRQMGIGIILNTGTNFYGNWCGIGGSGETWDDLDAACKAHDKCYGDAGLSGLGGVTGSSKAGRACDRQLCENAYNVDCHISRTPIQCEAAKLAVMGAFCANGTR